MPSHPWNSPAIVLNRDSGTIAGIGPEKVVEGLKALFEKEGITPQIEAVSGPEILGALDRAINGPSDMIIIGGGDGTVASAATRLAGQSKPLGILPLGTFNLAARDMGMPLDWEAAALALLDAPVGEMDLLDLDGELYFCVLVLGFYPALAMGREEYHGSWIIKSLKSLREIFTFVASFPPLHLTFQDENGNKVQQRSRMVIIANNDYEDFFGLIPKRGTLDGGFLTVYVSSHKTRWGLFRSFFSWVRGKWKQDKEMHFFHAKELEIAVRRKRRLPVMRDGELSKLKLPLKVVLRPKAIRVLAPRLAEEAKKAEEAKLAEAEKTAE